MFTFIFYFLDHVVFVDFFFLLEQNHNCVMDTPGIIVFHFQAWFFPLFFKTNKSNFLCSKLILIHPKKKSIEHSRNDFIIIL